MDNHEATAEELLQGYVTNRVEAFLAQYGKRIIGWDEILEGDISQSATIMSWRGVDGGIAASKAGHDVIMTPNTHCYLDYYQSRRIQDEPFAIGGFVNVEKVYSFEPFTQEMTPDQKKHILGVQANLWTEYIKTPEHQEYMLLPRMSALSEVQWCSVENRDYDNFLDKMTSMVEIYEALGYNYAKHIFEVIPVIGVDVENGCPQVGLTTQGDAPMYYTLDGSEPTASSTRYTGPVSIKDGEVFKAIVARDNMQTKVFTQTFARHKAMGKSITMNTEPSALYRTGLPGSLVNGVLNEDADAAAGEWMAWRGEPVEVVIDMAGESYERISVRTFVSKWEDMYAPLGMSAYVSDDNENFTLLSREEYQIEEERVPDGIKLFDLEFPQTSARYLKVIINTVPALPAWSERPGKPAYLFLDEIKVE
jgi:hexosaminidase